MLCLVLASAGDPKIADVRRPSGDVTLTRNEEPLGVRAVGPRVVNGDVHDRDQVSTGSAATCDVIFADDSRVSLDAQTTVRFEQRSLRRATQSGQSLGRRIYVITGHVASDIVPNQYIQTDFVTPAATAAVRGTFVNLSVLGAAVEIAVSDGELVMALTGGQAVFVLPNGGHIRLVRDAAPGTFLLQNLGGQPIAGQFGSAFVRINAEGHMVFQSGPNGFRILGGAGVSRLDPNTGQWSEMTTGDSVTFSPQPLADDSDPLVEEEEPPLPERTDQFGPTSSFLGASAADVASQLTTTLFPRIIDDFERANNTVIGNGWTEVVPSEWTILNGRADGVIPGDGLPHFLARSIGHRDTFDIQATFTFSINADPFLAVNASGVSQGTGMIALVQTGADFLTVIGPSGQQNVVIPSLPFSTDFTVRLTYDGTQLCGHLTMPGIVDQTLCLPTSNAGGDHIHVGAETGIGAPGTVTVDDIIEFQPP